MPVPGSRVVAVRGQARVQATNVVGLAVFIATATLLGTPPAATLPTAAWVGALGLNVGANLLAKPIEELWPSWRRFLLGPPDPVRADLRAAVLSAFRKALTRLEEHWQELARNEGREDRKARDAVHGLFRMLREDAARILRPDTDSTASAHEHVQLVLTTHGPGAWRDVFERTLSEYLYGHDPGVVRFLSDRLPQELQAQLLAELSDERNGRARHAFELMTTAALSDRLEQVDHRIRQIGEANRESSEVLVELRQLLLELRAAVGKPTIPALTVRQLRRKLREFLTHVDEDAISFRLLPYLPRHFSFDAFHQEVRVRKFTSRTWGRTDTAREGRAYESSGEYGRSHWTVIPWRRMAAERRIMVLGDPGAGKSWLLRSEVHQSVADALRMLDAGANVESVLVPVLVRADELSRELAKGAALGGGTPAALLRILKGRHSMSPAFTEWLANRLNSGGVSLLIDALDELPEDPEASSHKTLAEALSAWVHDNPGRRLLVTSRLAGYTGPPVNRPGMTVVEVAPFGRREMDTLIRAWLPDHRAAWLQAQLRNNPAAAGMARTPLLLTLLCALAEDQNERLPQRRGDLYEHVLRRFLGHEHRPPPASREEIDRSLELLGYVAFTFASGRSGWVDLMNAQDLRDAIRHSGQAYEDFRTSGQGAADLIIKFSRDDGILIPAGDPSHGRTPPYLFLHRSFHEFLVADHLSRLPFDQWWPVIDSHLWFDPDWEEVIGLLAGRLPDPLLLLQALDRSGQDPFHLLLSHAGRAAAEMPPGQAADLIAKAVGDLVGFIRSPSQYDRNLSLRMCQRLARASVPQALNSLNHIVSHSDRDLRRIAAVALQGTTDPIAIRRLVELTETTDSAIRKDAVIALNGTFDRVAVHRLMELLQDRDAEIQGLAATALGGTTDPTIISQLVRLLGDPDPGVVRRAATALEGTNDPAFASRLVDLLATSPEPLIHNFAASAFEGIDDAAAVSRLVKLLENADPRIRMRAALALKGTMDHTAISRLVQLLEDPDVRVVRWAALALQGSTDPQQSRG
jgi:HEAT repeat protein